MTAIKPLRTTALTAPQGRSSGIAIADKYAKALGLGSVVSEGVATGHTWITYPKGVIQVATSGLPKPQLEGIQVRVPTGSKTGPKTKLIDLPLAVAKLAVTSGYGAFNKLSVDKGTGEKYYFFGRNCFVGVNKQGKIIESGDL